MSNSTLHQFTLNKQGRQEVSKPMERYALINLLHRIIREYGKYDGCDYSVSLKDITLSDRKLILSYVLESIEDYEVIANSETSINESFKEHADSIMELIDAQTSEVYHEDMREMGLSVGRHHDNGETYYYRR